MLLAFPWLRSSGRGVRCSPIPRSTPPTPSSRPVPSTERPLRPPTTTKRNAMASEAELIADLRCATGESPVWVAAEQALYWVDIPHRELLRWNAADGQVFR